MQVVCRLAINPDGKICFTTESPTPHLPVWGRWNTDKHREKLCSEPRLPKFSKLRKS
jgi:hypothetical protein